MLWPPGVQVPSCGSQLVLGSPADRSPSWVQVCGCCLITWGCCGWGSDLNIWIHVLPSCGRQQLAAEAASPSTLLIPCQALLGRVTVPSLCPWRLLPLYCSTSLLRGVGLSLVVEVSMPPLPLLVWCHQPMGATQQVVVGQARLQLPSPTVPVRGHWLRLAGPSMRGRAVGGEGCFACLPLLLRGPG